MSAPATFAAHVAGTQPSDPIAELLSSYREQSMADSMRFGVLHANLCFALGRVDGHPMAMAALESAIEMIRERCPSLRPEAARMVDVLPVQS